MSTFSKEEIAERMVAMIREEESHIDWLEGEIEKAVEYCTAYKDQHIGVTMQGYLQDILSKSKARKADR